MQPLPICWQALVIFAAIWLIALLVNLWVFTHAE